MDRLAAVCAEVVWRSRRVAEDHLHALERDVELVGDDLCERGADPLAEVDLARQRREGAVGVETDPVFDPGRRRRTPAHVADARCTARTTRLYTPHRQRWFAMRSLIAASVGCGSC